MRRGTDIIPAPASLLRVSAKRRNVVFAETHLPGYRHRVAVVETGHSCPRIVSLPKPYSCRRRSELRLRRQRLKRLYVECERRIFQRRSLKPRIESSEWEARQGGLLGCGPNRTGILGKACVAKVCEQPLAGVIKFSVRVGKKSGLWPELLGNARLRGEYIDSRLTIAQFK